MAEYTPKGTLKRDPNAPKSEPPATPEERARRVAEARARARAARAAMAAGAPAAPRPAPQGAVEAAPTAPAAEPAAAAPAPPPAGGALRTPKGTLKRDPNAPKAEPPATPEERARRVAEARARALAAREAQAAGAAPAASGGLPPAAAAAAAAAAVPGETDAERAERRRIFEIVTRGVPGAEPVLRPVVAGRAERAPARAEFTITEEMEDTVRLFREGLPDVEFTVLTSPLDVVLVIDRKDVLRVMRYAKEHPALDMKFLRFVTGVDLQEEGIEIVYGLKSLTTKRSCLIKTVVPLHDPVVDSVTPVWAGAEWHERELMEMFGVVCKDHPDPRNLLLDEDMTIHPLRKAHPLAEVELKQGVNVF
jgi:NADH-quinone oxidoreductase subunit C